MANRRPFVRSRGPRRSSQWVASADQGYQNVSTGAKVILESNPGLINTTIVRTRGSISIAPQTMVADVDIQGAFGIGIVSDEAFAAGAASIPGPWTNGDWGGWFVWRPFAFQVEFIDGTGSRIVAWPQLEIDSKGMRKVAANETLVVMAESQGGAFSIAAPHRYLVKLA